MCIRDSACAAMAAAPSGMRAPAHVTPRNAVPSRRTCGARRLRPTPDVPRRRRGSRRWRCCRRSEVGVRPGGSGPA
eukprot:156327-Prymnesium_polylepis.1